MYEGDSVGKEFFKTYFWAFIVLGAVFMVLTQYDIINPEQYFPEQCRFGSAFKCQDQIISSEAGDIRLLLVSTMSEPVTVTDLQFFNIAGEEIICETRPEFPQPWLPGDDLAFVSSDCNLNQPGIFPGEKSKINARISYYLSRSGPEFAFSKEGEIAVVVQ